MKNKKIGVNCDIPLPWPQDRPPEEKTLQVFTREETRENYDIKNQNGNDRSKKFGVDYDILFPWPQDRPPDKNLLQGFMREEEVT